MDGTGSARGRRAALLLVAVALVVWSAMHLSTLGASWSQAWRMIAHLGWRWPLFLGVVWLLGLVVHTTERTSSLPGLTHPRPLPLHLSIDSTSTTLHPSATSSD